MYMSETKYCISCQETKERSAQYFQRDKNREDGFYCYCKVCLREKKHTLKRKCEICQQIIDDRSKSNRCSKHTRNGKTLAREWRDKIAVSKLAEKNVNWKGDDVGYSQLHVWVKRRLQKPALCQDCQKVPPYDLANKGTYDRNLDNWEWLCRRCHMIKDGRLENLTNKRKG